MVAGHTERTTMAKNRYHLSAYFSDFVEAESLDEAWDIFEDMVKAAKAREFLWELQGVEEQLPGIAE